MKITVCELPNNSDQLEKSWAELVRHVANEKSDLVLLPEMPFYRWLSDARKPQAEEWMHAADAHMNWINRFAELDGARVAATRPAESNGNRINMGFLWDPEQGVRDIHAKHHLPDEPGYWEASWYNAGPDTFEVAETPVGNIGFLICTELWFMRHARDYMNQDIQILCCPRATPEESTGKWISGGQAAAVISGAYCISSNLAGPAPQSGMRFGGTGWIIEPEEGNVIAATSKEQPYITVEVDLRLADNAKKSYPRYVSE